MSNGPEHRPHTTETARQRAITRAQVNLIGLLAGAVLALVLRRYLGS